MRLGTWNLEVYPRSSSPRGVAMRQVMESFHGDVWFLTELHADFALDGFRMAYAQPRDNAPPYQRKAAIASLWPMEAIQGKNDPAEGRLCLARLTSPTTGESILAATPVTPWRGATPYWREVLQKKDLSYAEAFDYLLEYFVQRIEAERRPGEMLILGGDFNQGLVGRDYVGTLQGRASLTKAFESLGLQVPTMTLRALIETHPAIDHIAVPSQWNISIPAQVHRPEHNGRHLSDHALYVVDVDQPDPGPARMGR